MTTVATIENSIETAYLNFAGKVLLRSRALKKLDFGKLKAIADEMLTTLSPKEKDIIDWRFGLTSGKKRTLASIGDVYGITREAVRQWEVKSLKKLRQPECVKPLKKFVSSK